MSPQSRRGRAAPVSHHKSPARGAATASRKPAAAVDESDDELADGVDPKAATLAPVRRRRGMARLRKSPAYKYASEAFGAYLPLFLLFLVVLGSFWGWTVFGPHTPTPKENWMSIETKWIQPRQDARQHVTDAVSDFKALQVGYKEFRDATKGWMDDLAAVKDWEGPHPSYDPSQYYTSTQLVQQFIDAGNAQVTLLDQVIAAQAVSEVLAIGTDIINADKTFDTTYANAYTQIVGSFNLATEPPLALPSGSICPSLSPSASPSLSPSPSPSPSASPSRASSASPLAGTSLSPSPSIVVSPSPSASIDPCAVASPSPAAT